MAETQMVPSLSLSEIKKEDVATRAEIREGNAKRQEGLVKIPIADIVVRADFNLRKEWGDIEGLAKSMLAIGQKLPIRVDALKSGKFLLVDGERRFRAALYIVENKLSPEFTDVLAIINDRDETELSRLITMLTSNDAKSFEPVEEAEGYKRMRDIHQLEPINISRATGKSIAYVEQRLLLADASEEEKEMVKQGEVSATVVMEQSRHEKDASKRTAKIKEAKAQGKKLKVKDVKGKKPKGPSMDELVEELDALLKDAIKDCKAEYMHDYLKSMKSVVRKMKG